MKYCFFFYLSLSFIIEGYFPYLRGTDGDVPGHVSAKPSAIRDFRYQAANSERIFTLLSFGVNFSSQEYAHATH